MKKFLFILILLVVLSPKFNAQNFAEEHYQFDSIYKTIEGYYNRGLYFKAAQLPEKLKDNRYVNASVHFFFARVYSLSNEFDKTLFSLKNAVERGISIEYINQMYDLDNFRKSNLNVIFESSYPSWHQSYLDKQKNVVLDSVYINQIKEINKSSSKIWDGIKYNQNGGIDDVNDSLTLYTLYYKEDSLSNYVFDLILEKGFPTRKKVGKEFYSFSRRFVSKIPNDLNLQSKKWKKVKKAIDVEMGKGNLKPFYYAFIEDNNRFSRNQLQFYGTMPVILSNGTNRINSIKYENPEELNLRRKSVGLCSIQLELWSEARELPESLKNVEFK